MIVLDVETTGLTPAKHSIASLGAIDFSNPEREFYEECQIWLGAEISPRALEINGFTEEQLHDPSKPALEQLIRRFLFWAKSCEDKTLAGENISFDTGFLEDSMRRYGIKYTFGHRGIDLHSISYERHKELGIPVPMRDDRSDLSLDETLEFVGLPAEPKPHNALTGAKMEAEAFHRLRHGRFLFKEYKRYLAPDYLIKR